MKPAYYLIPGYIEPHHLDILYNLVQGLTVEGPVFEIGSFKGRSSSALGLSCKKAKRMFICVDPWAPCRNHHGTVYKSMDKEYAEFLKNMKSVGLIDGRDFIHYRSTSTEVVSKIDKLSMIFVDGSHEYEEVIKDLGNYVPKVVPGGIVAAHDYGDPAWPGPSKAWNEYMKKYRPSRNGNLIWTKV